MTPEQIATIQRLTEIFMPHASDRPSALVDRKGRFAHYTSAEAALQIIRTKTMWMRNTNCMADYSEVGHGFALLNRYFQSEQKRKPFIDEFDKISPNMGQQ